MNQRSQKEVQEGLFSRSKGILTEDITSKTVIIVGTGSVGSYLAENFCRSGISKFILIDHDRVELSNLCRTTYKLKDVDKYKVEALANHLLEINPHLELIVKPQSILDFQLQDLAELMQKGDLILATTDEPKAQRLINHFAYHFNKPALFVGLYEGAKGGEVILSIPEQTPCYLCATSIRHQAEENFGEVQSKLDYGTSRLVGEVALAADIHHVSSVAVKLGLSLLLPQESSAKLKDFVQSAINLKFSYLTLSMEKDYWFYPQLFGDIPGQYAYQSVWLTPEEQNTCPVCGDLEHRRNPLESVLQPPLISKLQKQITEVNIPTESNE